MNYPSATPLQINPFADEHRSHVQSLMKGRIVDFDPFSYMLVSSVFQELIFSILRQTTTGEAEEPGLQDPAYQTHPRR